MPAFAPPLSPLPPCGVAVGAAVACTVVPVGVEPAVLSGASNSEAVTLKQTSFSVKAAASTYVYIVC